MIMHPVKLLLAFALLAGVVALPTASHAQSSKSESASSSKKSQANDEFEENRRAHMQKSKENNANTGAN